MDNTALHSMQRGKKEEDNKHMVIVKNKNININKSKDKNNKGKKSNKKKIKMNTQKQKERTRRRKVTISTRFLPYNVTATTTCTTNVAHKPHKNNADANIYEQLMNLRTTFMNSQT